MIQKIQNLIIMNTQSKQIIEERLKKLQKSYSKHELDNFSIVLKQFIEHPTKPGYKRKDIEYFIKLIENDTNN